MKHFDIYFMLAKHYDRDPKTYTLEQVEIDYKKEVEKFSDAYLAGSNWYVGDSYIHYLKNKKFDTRVFGPAAAYALNEISKSIQK
tara:strand:- start:159 stop:413 length:255 start_codon:yes stop_codon:yes gene_type:complete